jgi:hypothetical protein
MITEYDIHTQLVNQYLLLGIFAPFPNTENLPLGLISVQAFQMTKATATTFDYLEGNRISEKNG